MNLQALTSRYVALVNPNETITILPSNGYTTNADGSRSPSYGNPVTVQAQIQDLSGANIMQVQGLNIAANSISIYLAGNWYGVSRGDGKGGDIIIRADTTRYLITAVLEQWGGNTGWTKVTATRQTT